MSADDDDCCVAACFRRPLYIKTNTNALYVNTTMNIFLYLFPGLNTYIHACIYTI